MPVISKPLAMPELYARSLQALRAASILRKHLERAHV